VNPPPAFAGGECDVAVIGAGCAGLAAATHLRAAGLTTCLLEAAPTPGGRCQTQISAILHHTPFDAGAQWFHNSEHNPLLAQVQKAGIATTQGPAQGLTKFLYQSTLAPHHADLYQVAEASWIKTLTAKLSGPDISVREAADSLLAEDPFAATVETFEANLIAAAPAGDLSLQDWHTLRLTGTNTTAPLGLGAAVLQTLTLPAGPVHLNTIVTEIDATTTTHITITTNHGTLRAQSIILTVSIGVLQSESIKFTPALPQTILAALNGLRMGQMTKLALPATGPGRLDCPPGTDVVRRVAPQEGTGVFTVMWPSAHAYVTAFTGARLAQTLESTPLAEATQYVRDDLTAIFGAEAKLLFSNPQALRTRWGQNPFTRGAYAYARPGHAAARQALSTPIWDGRLLIAGEANAPQNLAGTAAGAYLAGLQAAQEIYLFSKTSAQRLVRKADSV